MAARALNLFAPQEQAPNDFASPDEITRRRMMAKALSEAAAAQQVKHPLQGVNVLAQSAISGLEDMRASRDEKTRQAAMAQALGGMSGEGGALNPEALQIIFALDPQLGLNLQQQAYQREQAAKAEAAAAADREYNRSRPIEVGGRLVDPRTYEPVYEPPAPPVAPVKVSPGEALVDPSNPAAGPIYTAPAAPPKPEETFKDESSLRNAYVKASEPFVARRQAFSRVQAVAGDDTGASDIALVFSYMHLIEPTSAVKEGEFATAEQTGGLPERIVGLYNSVVQGTRLTPAQRAEFLKTAETLYSSAEQQQAAVDQTYGGLAENYGFNPRNVVIDVRGGVKVPTPEEAAGIQGEATPRDGGPRRVQIQQFQGDTLPGGQPLVTPEAAAGVPKDITEEDIEYTMKIHGLTREQVLQRLQGNPNAP